MKINWGTRIAIFYTLFVIVMVSMVVKSCQHQVHLVEENYYQKDLEYEEFRVKKFNGIKFQDQIQINFNRDEHLLSVKFPSDQKHIDGFVKLYRPSNKFFDKKYKISLDTAQSMAMDLSNHSIGGLWMVQIDWTCNSELCYNEIELSL